MNQNPDNQCFIADRILCMQCPGNAAAWAALHGQEPTPNRTSYHLRADQVRSPEDRLAYVRKFLQTDWIDKAAIARFLDLCDKLLERERP